MVEFLKIKPDYTKSFAVYQHREEFFRHHYDLKKVVPWYVINESIFQTGGGDLFVLLRKTKKAGVIISIKKFDYSRPILAGERVYYEAYLKALKNESAAVCVKAYNNSFSMENGMIIFGLSSNVVSKKLNNSRHEELNQNTQYFMGDK